MLKLIIEGGENFDEETETFEEYDDTTIELEHSLISLSKWESKYQKPFLSTERKTPEELFGYIRAMVVTITPSVDLDVLYRLEQEHIDRIQAYIDSPQSATTFGMMPDRRGPSEVITSELIYYWMTAFTIPWEAEHWHLNRLFSLIRICNIKNSPQKPMSRHEIALRNRELNAQRKKELGTKG